MQTECSRNWEKERKECLQLEISVLIGRKYHGKKGLRWNGNRASLQIVDQVVLFAHIDRLAARVGLAASSQRLPHLLRRHVQRQPAE